MVYVALHGYVRIAEKTKSPGFGRKKPTSKRWAPAESRLSAFYKDKKKLGGIRPPLQKIS
jgi:hypothetical protein